MTCWAVVAVKWPAAGKGRLAEVLSAEQRQQLVQSMFLHVVATLQAAASVDGMAIVTPEPQRIEQLLGAEVVRNERVLLLADPNRGLNGAFMHAAEVLAQRGADELLVLHADLPLLSPAEVDQLIVTGRQTGFAIAPDKLAQGTNGVFLALPTRFQFQFGADSCALHLAEAARLGWSAQRVRLAGFEFDVDEPEDLSRLQQQLPEYALKLRQPCLLNE